MIPEIKDVMLQLYGVLIDHFTLWGAHDTYTMLSKSKIGSKNHRLKTEEKLHGYALRTTLLL